VFRLSSPPFTPAPTEKDRKMRERSVPDVMKEEEEGFFPPPPPLYYLFLSSDERREDTKVVIGPGLEEKEVEGRRKDAADIRSPPSSLLFLFPPFRPSSWR